MGPDSGLEAEAEARELLAEVKAALAATPNTPLSTYRVQFHQGFRFEDARARVPYLARLGVTHLYASPYLKAAPGSLHGYDVVDHQSLNPEVGTPAEHETLCEALGAHGMGQVLDVVPNHMGIERGNALWWDVLENGPASLRARWFDIDWDPVKVELKDKVLLPVLEDQYGVVLERGGLALAFEDGAFTVRYHDRTFPVAPTQYAAVLGHRLEELERELGAGDPGQVELLSILTALRNLPPSTETDESRRLERDREKEVIKRRLAALVAQHPALDAFVRRNVELFNGVPGEPRSFDLLDVLLDGGSYRLAHWRVAAEEINYRRFFDVNGLAALRVEDPVVFEETHTRIFHWLREGRVMGLRIDHPDGLFDPTAYFLDLQERYVVERARAVFSAAHPGGEARFAELEGPLRALFRAEVEARPDSPLRRALYIVVEKIQGGRERIPDSWAVHGTVGYRFANAVTGILVDRDGERSLTDAYARFTGHRWDFDELRYAKKKQVLTAQMSSEVNVLARELNRISEMNRRSRDFTLNALRRALVEFIALFPVYRTYVDPWRAELDARDVEYIRWTLARARERDRATSASPFDFLEDILLRRYPEHLAARERDDMLRFAMKLQQLTGPVMAKGLEDTVFYLYNRLVALNEVGGEPEQFGLPVSTFHLRNQERAEHPPAALLTTSTHDTKRSEDVRARIAVLSELPDTWRARLRQWARLNRRHKTQLEGRLLPVANDEYLYYQSLLGVWPMGEPLAPGELERLRDRLREYMLKAVREAKVNTSWVNPDPRYDGAMVRFVERTLDPALSGVFLEDAAAFKRRIERPGQVNALTQVLLKLASPGTADFYQGSELWDLSLVDPDNRRPVDYDLRQRLLEELDAQAREDREGLSRRLGEALDDGRAKLLITAEGLRLRQRHPALFRAGDYRPLDVSGPRAAHAVAFSRHHAGAAVVAVAPRLTARLLDEGGLAGGLAGTRVRLPDGLEDATLRDVFTGRRFRGERQDGGAVLDVGALLELLPVALLEAEAGRVQ